MKKLIEKIIPKLSFKFPYSAEEYSKELIIENYHCHKMESNAIQADCAESIENYAKQTRKYGGQCLFSGEHGWQGNAHLCYNTATEYNLKYRHSAEAYWVKDRKEKDNSNCHVVLVAKNNEGKGDLNFALSMANIDGYYYKPRLDLEILKNIPKDNMIITSACVAGWKYEDAENIWYQMWKHYGDNFFLELQYHHTEKQKKLNKRIMKMARKYGIQIIVGMDSHYIDEKNSVKRKQILKYKNINYPDEQGWFMDYPSGEETFKRFKEQGVLTDEEILTAMMNTNVFSVSCEEIVFDRSFKIPCVYPNTKYQERVKIFHNILNKRYKQENLKNKEKVKGIKWEAEQITESGVVDYFLTNDKIVNKATTEKGGILTTTSRGSSASFVVNKLLGFTTVDRFNSEIPIYPERFLTKERVQSGQMPDIDYNVATQEPFVEATRDLVGEHGCYPLMAIEKLKEKASWQLYAGANDIEPQIANQISKYIDKYNEKLKYADDEDKPHIHVEDFIPEEYIDIYRQSLDYQGTTIKLKVHACGFLLFDGDIRREIGLVSAVSETTKKRTLCVAIEGGYLDEFGYVKNDFLIVDSVHLTARFFESIGKPVPSFDQLRDMIDGDKKTWDIYAKGITCCVNQCEKASTTKKVMQYKPTNLAELSAFIAGIRPGFASLINMFLARESYTTGEPKIDELLEDSYHYMLYQESLMKLLSFLGVPMRDAYGVIKGISKKKLKGKKLQELENTLKTNWNRIIGNTDNFDKIWQVFSDSSRYAFNSPHALSMGGDSSYQAWFKAHHTDSFYEVAINHYQDKNKKAKIEALLKEAIKYFNYKLGDYEFGKDNRRVNIDRKHKIIYPNLSSVKGFGEQVSESLYELGRREYDTFIDFLKDVKGTPINKTVLGNLIKLDYFKKFGSINYLLKVVEIHDFLLNSKKTGWTTQLAKEKILNFGLTVDYVKEYGNETEKQINKLRSEELLIDLMAKIPNTPTTLKETLDNQREILDIVTHTDKEYSKKIFYVSELEVMKSITKTKLYCINNGKTHEVKMWTNGYNRNQFELGDFLYIEKSGIEKKNQRKPSGEINPKTGKKIYVPIEGKFEFWLNRYRNITYEFMEE